MMVFLFGLTGGVVAGTVLAHAAGIVALPVAVYFFCGLLALAMLFLFRGGCKSSAGLVVSMATLLGAVLAMASYSGAKSTYDSNPLRVHLRKSQNCRMRVRGRILEEPDASRASVSFALAVERAEFFNESGESLTVADPCGQVRVRIARPWDCSTNVHECYEHVREIKAYGDIIEVQGVATLPEPPRNPNAFSLPAYFREQRLLAELTADAGDVKILERRVGNPVVAVALWLKQRLSGVYAEAVSSPSAELAMGATLGDRAALSGREFQDCGILEMFARAGISHVLAVSGLHVGIIALALYKCGRLARVSPKALAPIVIVALCLLTIMTGARPATVRAAIMTSLAFVIHVYWGKNARYSALTGVAVAGSIIVLWNPLLLFSPGFQLSFAAVLSLLLLTPPLHRHLRSLTGAKTAFAGVWFLIVLAVMCRDIGALFTPSGCLAVFASLVALDKLGGMLNSKHPTLAVALRIEHLPRGITLFVAAQAAIQIGAILPLSAWYFGRYSVAGMFVNFAAIPLIALFVQAGLLTGVVGLIPFFGGWLAVPFGFVASALGTGFFWLAWIGAQAFPYPAVPKPILGSIMAYYTGLLLLWIIIETSPAKTEDVTAHNGIRPMPRRLRTGLAWALGLLAMTSWVAGHRCALRPGRPSLTVLHIQAAPRRPAYPVVCGIAAAGTGFLVNGGDEYVAERLVFRFYIWAGVLRVPEIHLSTERTRAGFGALGALGEALGITTCHTAVCDKIAEKLKDRGISGVRVNDGTAAEARCNSRVTMVAEAITTIRLGTCRITVLTDTPRIRDIEELEPCDILVLPWKLGVLEHDDTSRSSAMFRQRIETVLDKCRAECIIVTDGGTMNGFDIFDWSRRFPWNPKVFRTRDHGAITIESKPTGFILLGYAPESSDDGHTFFARKETLLTHRKETVK